MDLISRRAVISRFCQRDGTTSTHIHPIVPSFCGSACLPLLILVPSPLLPTHPFHLISQMPTKSPIPQIHQLLEPSDSFFSRSHFCSSSAELFGRKFAGIVTKIAKQVGSVEAFSRGKWMFKRKRSFQLLISRFACT
jgi:hypothetical protein